MFGSPLSTLVEEAGSVPHEDFNADSDVDLLASVRPGGKCGLFEWVDWQEGLARIFPEPWIYMRSGDPAWVLLLLKRPQNSFRRGAAAGIGGA
jgi:hypothetical protein